jgi:hypothetical protein
MLVIKIEMCIQWMVHCHLYITTTNYKIVTKGHYIELFRTKLYDKRDGPNLLCELSIYI